MNLHTESAVADLFGITAEKAADLRKRQSWPHVRIDRFTIRYTDDQIAEIIRSRSEAGVKAPTKSTGLTSRSARKAS